jgi:hypothetical protein
LILTHLHTQTWRHQNIARTLTTLKNQKENKMKKTLKGNQKRIAAMAPPFDKITQADFIVLKKRKSSKKKK